MKSPSTTVLAIFAAIIPAGSLALHLLARATGEAGSGTKHRFASQTERAKIPGPSHRQVKSPAVREVADEERGEPLLVTTARFATDDSAVAPASVSPEVPGAQLRVGDQTVAVEAFTLLPGRPGPALTVTFSPAMKAAETAASGSTRQGTGFTYEDQLFRTKWGWAAHEAVRRAARGEAQTVE